MKEELKKISIALCLAIPLGNLMDMVSSMAYGNEKDVTQIALNYISGICIIVISMIISKKLIKP